MDNSLRTPSFEDFSCPLPFPQNQRIVLGHGSGGKMTHDLVKNLFLSRFQTRDIDLFNDAAVFSDPNNNFAISTDCHVVAPIFFPGGDIGRLAVCGTVNDLAMVGAIPRYLTAGFIIEEGLSFEILDRITASMQAAAVESKIQIIAGDTKVVQKGKADELYITTSGFGVIPVGIKIRGSLAQPGDLVLVSGTVGDHGIAVLSARGELGLETEVVSDVAPVSLLVHEMLELTTDIHVLRDPTRGGVATTLNEIAQQSGVCITLFEEKIPVNPSVLAACEMLGFNPLYIANEGKFIVIAPPTTAKHLLELMHQHPLGRDATIIGEVSSSPKNRVLMKTIMGSSQILDMLSGELLPRIC
jgi:hydrogenase expression/formation protein HypE